MKTIPSSLISFVPLLVLVALLSVTIYAFGDSALSGASQICLLVASAVCASIGMWCYSIPWKDFESAIQTNVKRVSEALFILLVIGALSGVWMVSGIVPSMIYYGLQLIHPVFFLVTTCVICSVVSVMTGSSWTTVATIGVALIGIGQAQGFHEGWTAGAIISGAYFGDKISPLSDTTVLASSTNGVRLFTHIRYLMYTTVPALVIALLVYLIVGFLLPVGDDVTIQHYSAVLSDKFDISLWAMVVPLITALMIVKRVPSLITLFLSTMFAAIYGVLFQTDVLMQINPTGHEVMSLFKGVMQAVFGATQVEMGSAELNELVGTGGMAGMMDTIWLILCAMCFGGVMQAGGFLDGISRLFLKYVRKTLSLVTSTVLAGLLFNIITADQYISIILTGGMFKQTYHDQGCEARLLSRTTEDAVTVTSPLIPWNTCGMTQASVLGVSTWTYLPYSIFNYLCPLVSILIAATGFRIVRTLRKADK
ncbi:MAG: Na+/H+ antiporter NhaC [Bacteroidaceae bacterium]|nr:Na+/H+ antiporter NhaC [Bacteroidaceae bacterium]